MIYDSDILKGSNSSNLGLNEGHYIILSRENGMHLLCEVWCRTLYQS